MNIRTFQKNDQKAVEEIFSLYWTDPEFLEELSSELQLCLENAIDCGFFVAEENNETIGIIGFKKLPDYLRSYTLTHNPIELYIIAVKYKRKGIGSKLKLHLIEETRKFGFSEILLYSPHTHNESWNFHDGLDFERSGEVTPPVMRLGKYGERFCKISLQ